MKIVLFVNDSYFAYLLARHVMEKFLTSIVAVVFTTKIKGSLSNLMDVFRKTHWRYFFYRSMVQLLSYYNSLFGRKTVSSLVKQNNIRSFSVSNVNAGHVVKDIQQADLALAFNFDQILKDGLIQSFRKGVINVHASRLPMDKGVSPVLWAFARGDKSIWASIYQMDGGLDTGKIYRQIEIPVMNNDTAFSLYERVCARCGEELSKVVGLFVSNEITPVPQSNDTEGRYWSWPDRMHRQMMRENKREFINFGDVLRMLKKY
ncbi:MAG: hypothetical protein HZA16_03860 [Nitrospirae bacterium]|nr:hypothetical protein [Nitrospirota bacterium]